MLIAVPSKGEQDLQPQIRFPNCVFMFRKEVHQCNGIVKNIVGVPKEVRGITPTRNWYWRIQIKSGLYL